MINLGMLPPDFHNIYTDDELFPAYRIFKASKKPDAKVMDQLSHIFSQVSSKEGSPQLERSTPLEDYVNVLISDQVTPKMDPRPKFMNTHYERSRKRAQKQLNFHPLVLRSAVESH